MQAKDLTPIECENKKCYCNKCERDHKECWVEVKDCVYFRFRKINFLGYCHRCLQEEEVNNFHPWESECNYFEDWLRRLTNERNKRNTASG